MEFFYQDYKITDTGGFGMMVLG